jgi:hypothetical protein
MEKKSKIILIILGVLVLCFVLDFASIFIFKKPIFAVNSNCKCGYTMYQGLLYNTYKCPGNSSPQVKFKWTKYNCSTNNSVVDIIDTTKNIKDFNCAEALESIYTDKNYTYYLPCIKSKYIIVKYEDGQEETIVKALKNGNISIKDLDEYDIEYYKESKNNVFKITIDKSNEKKIINALKIDNKIYEYTIYYYDLNSVKIKINDADYDLVDALKNKKITINNIIDSMSKGTLYRDGGSKLYNSNRSIIDDSATGFRILKCNTIDGNKDVYIGPANMKYEDNFCK